MLLGTGHMFLMASQQMLTVRCANAAGRDIAFGHFMVAISVGQGLGPFIVGQIGGGVTVPATGPLFFLGLVTAVLCLAVSFAIRPDRHHRAHHEMGTPSRCASCCGGRGCFAIIAASIVTVTAGDLLVIYLPLLGTERSIEAHHIGMLLSGALALGAGGARLLCPTDFHGRTVAADAVEHLHRVGRLRAAGGAVAARDVCGDGVDRGRTWYRLDLDAVRHRRGGTSGGRGTAMTLRITGNRIGLVCMPIVAGLVAAATGAAGILFLTALTLATSAVALKRSQPRSG